LTSFEIAPSDIPDARPAKSWVIKSAGRETFQWIDPVLGLVKSTDSGALGRARKLYGLGMIGCAKHQLSTRDLKRYGLANDLDS